MLKAAGLAIGAVCAAVGLVVGAFVFHGWWTYHKNERSIAGRMDQYYLSLTAPAREDYLLESDEVFEVPYMASKLSVAAEPTRIYDLNDRLVGEFSTQRGVFVSSPDGLPVFLRKALVASEDGMFYQHHGFNWRATARALLVDLRHLKAAQGGSTLTQQLAKMMFTTRKKTFGRKIFELFCARKLEEKFTKDQILLMYLNFAYFGHGCFGVEEAARYYFDKGARELTIPESAMLIGIMPNPGKYSPFDHPDLAQARQRTVLARMAKLGFIPASEVEPLSAEFWRTWQGRSRDRDVSFWRMTVNEAPYPVEYLRRLLLGSFDKEKLLKGGLKIHTTFDLDAQKAAQRIMAQALREQNVGEPSTATVQGSMIALRPADGAILAMVGGNGFDFANQLNRAVDSKRLIGSAAKPFVYGVAFESGKYKPDDTIVDEPIQFKLPGGRIWAPHNFGNKFHGKVDLRFALADSINIVAVKLLQDLDIGQVIHVMSNASGVPVADFPRNLSLALGTVSFSALDLARAYSVFVNDGRSAEPYAVRYVEDRDGKVLVDNRNRPQSVPALKPETCATVVDLMKGVLREGGTARYAVEKTGFNIPAAGKTGTTTDYRDAWFAGVTPDLSAAVWMGHDDMRIPLGEGKVGGALSAPAWMEFVKAYYRDRPTRDFSAPVSTAPVTAAR